jgi:hypothetical protein
MVALLIAKGVGRAYAGGMLLDIFHAPLRAIHAYWSAVIAARALDKVRGPGTCQSCGDEDDLRAGECMRCHHL